MAKTILFVHGTGVRRASYEYTAARIIKGLDKVAPGVRLEPCLWGDLHGAKLSRGGASIPHFSMPEPAAPSQGQVAALWELLARDPFFELRELSAPADSAFVLPRVRERKDELSAKFIALQQAEAVWAIVADRVPAAQWSDAVAMVSKAESFASALEAAAMVDTTLRIALARALIACVQQQLLENYLPVLPGQLRDRLMEACIEWLGGRELGPVRDWITSKLKGLAYSWATAKARRERDVLFNAASPTAGDVLLYQARGAGIRRFIEQRINECGDDVVILAHSLGGIACVDLLIERPMPQVKLLVTVGSQAPFMYEIGALCSLPAGEPLPAHFRCRWVNFYDVDDLLSYAAAEVFPGRAEDHAIDTDEPFPLSHSGYWNVDALWDKLRPYLSPGA